MSIEIRSRLVRHPLQDYLNRDCVFHLLDSSVFDVMCDNPVSMSLMICGCLDAINYIPSGSTVSVSHWFHESGSIVR